MFFSFLYPPRSCPIGAQDFECTYGSTSSGPLRKSPFPHVATGCGQWHVGKGLPPTGHRGGVVSAQIETSSKATIASPMAPLAAGSCRRASAWSGYNVSPVRVRLQPCLAFLMQYIQSDLLTFRRWFSYLRYMVKVSCQPTGDIHGFTKNGERNIWHYRHMLLWRITVLSHSQPGQSKSVFEQVACSERVAACQLPSSTHGETLDPPTFATFICSWHCSRSWHWWELHLSFFFQNISSNFWHEQRWVRLSLMWSSFCRACTARRVLNFILFEEHVTDANQLTYLRKVRKKDYEVPSSSSAACFWLPTCDHALKHANAFPYIAHWIFT